MIGVVSAPRRLIWLCAGLSASLCANAAALGQTLSTNSASFNAGYGRQSGSENQPVNVVTRDANGNRVVADGLILSGESQSGVSASWGAADTWGGVGGVGSSASAIGNNLVVVTQGSFNTVIVNSRQTNSGAVTAGVGK